MGAPIPERLVNLIECTEATAMVGPGALDLWPCLEWELGLESSTGPFPVRGGRVSGSWPQYSPPQHPPDAPHLTAPAQRPLRAPPPRARAGPAPAAAARALTSWGGWVEHGGGLQGRVVFPLHRGRSAPRSGAGSRRLLVLLLLLFLPGAAAVRPVPCARRLNVAASSSDVPAPPASSRGGARRRWGPTPASWHLPGLQGTRRETGWSASFQPGAGAAV